MRTIEIYTEVINRRGWKYRLQRVSATGRLSRRGLARGGSVISNVLMSQDMIATCNAMEAFGRKHYLSGRSQ